MTFIPRYKYEKKKGFSFLPFLSVRNINQKDECLPLPHTIRVRALAFPLCGVFIHDSRTIILPRNIRNSEKFVFETRQYAGQ